MGIWQKKTDAERERSKEHEEMLKKMGQARLRHESWIREQFGNSADVVREARDLTYRFKEEHELKHGTIEPVFDSHGSHLGYFSKVRGRVANDKELVELIRQRTGETFEVDHILSD